VGRTGTASPRQRQSGAHFFVNYPSVGGDTSGTRIFLLDSLYYQANGDPTKDPIEKFVGRDSADFIGSAFYRCKGFAFSPHQAARESTTIALKTLPSHALHILTNWTRPARYGLTVLRGYYTADPRIGPDAYEENDIVHVRRLRESAQFRWQRLSPIP